MIRPNGFTLIELLLATTVTAILALLATSTLASAASGYRSSQYRQSLTADARRMSGLIAADIRRSLVAPVVLPPISVGQQSAVMTEVAILDIDGNPTAASERHIYCLDSQHDLLLFSGSAAGSPNGGVDCSTVGVSALFAAQPSMVALNEPVILAGARSLVQALQFTSLQNGLAVQTDLGATYSLGAAADTRAADVFGLGTPVIISTVAVRNSNYTVQ